jgi:hypothetical protein
MGGIIRFAFLKGHTGCSLEERLEECQNQWGGKNILKRKGHWTVPARVPIFHGWGKKDEPINNFFQEVALLKR